MSYKWFLLIISPHYNFFLSFPLSTFCIVSYDLSSSACNTYSFITYFILLKPFSCKYIPYTSAIYLHLGDGLHLFLPLHSLCSFSCPFLSHTLALCSPISLELIPLHPFQVIIQQTPDSEHSGPGTIHNWKKSSVNFIPVRRTKFRPRKTLSVKMYAKTHHTL